MLKNYLPFNWFKSNYCIWLAIFGVSLFLVNDFYWHWPVVGFIFLGTYLGAVGFMTYRFLIRFFQSSGLMLGWLAVLLNIFFLGFVNNIFLAWFKLTDWTILVSFILVLSFNFSLKYLKFPVVTEEKKINEKINLWLVVLMGVITAIGFWLIFRGVTGEYLISPWQVLGFWFVVVVSVLGLVAFYLPFSKESAKTVMVVILFFSFLVHGYLLVYNNGFGGDRWRHLGSEYRVMQEIEYQPTLLAKDVWYAKVLGVEVPRALVDGPKISYGFGWSLAVISAKAGQIDLFFVDKFLGWIIFSLAIPILLYWVLKQLGLDDRLALLGGAMTTIFYGWQYYGAQSLPAGYGLISLLMLWLLWLVVAKREKKWFFIPLIFSGLMYFGYSLAFILAVITDVIFLVYLFSPKFWWLKVMPLCLVVFIMEAYSGYGVWLNQWSLKSLFGAVVDRLNIFFYGQGQWLLGVNFWSPWISHLVALLALFLLVLAIWLILKKKDGLSKLPLVFLIILTANYLLAWLFLGGLHILSRRLDIFLVIPLLILLSIGLSGIIKIKRVKYFIPVILTFIFINGYITGPLLEANITNEDVKVMSYVWQEIQVDPQKYCVLADTWPLLALEAFSAQQVVAGNYESDFNHQQDQRVRDYQLIITGISDINLSIIKNSCIRNQLILILPKDNVNASQFDLLKKRLGEPQIFQNSLVYPPF